MIKYLSPYCFFLLIPLALIILLNIFYVGNEIKKIKSNNINNYLFSFFSFSKFRFKNWLLILACFFLIIASTGPQVGTRLTELKRQGIDIFIVLDVSKSMLAEDIAPNRIFKAKRLVSEMFNKLGSDRVGIIAYASTAIPVLPITTDFSSAKMFLESLNTDMLSSQGTSIIEAIELSKGYFDDDNQTNRVLCILSDGEDHEFKEDQLFSAIDESGITIFTIGLGSTKGAPIPIKEKFLLFFNF